MNREQFLKECKKYTIKVLGKRVNHDRKFMIPIPNRDPPDIDFIFRTGKEVDMFLSSVIGTLEDSIANDELWKTIQEYNRTPEDMVMLAGYTVYEHCPCPSQVKHYIEVDNK